MIIYIKKIIIIIMMIIRIITKPKSKASVQKVQSKKNFKRIFQKHHFQNYDAFITFKKKFGHSILQWVWFFQFGMMVDQLLGPRMILDIYRGHFGLSLTRTKLGAKKLIRFFFLFWPNRKIKLDDGLSRNQWYYEIKSEKNNRDHVGHFVAWYPHTHTPSNLVKVLLFWILSMFQTESTTSTRDKKY